VVDRPRQGELLRRHGLRLNKRLGQHFLVDERVRQRIVDAVAALEPVQVVELASGAGSLTFALADAGWPVRALEIDPRMIELLEAERGERHIEVEACDLAATDFGRFLSDDRIVFVGNLPYQVTSPILFALLEVLHRPQVGGAVIMVQNEVARRMAADPGSRESGILTVLLQAQLRVRRLFVVRPGSFLPPPAVDSAVVLLQAREDPIDLGASGRSLVRTLFGERRKQIGGILRRNYSVPDSALTELEDQIRVRPQARAEELSIEDFRRLDQWLQERQIA
jgi:16S rRNA (adenine1518-N6/adenine1519-N6)-dimethyltransferase